MHSNYRQRILPVWLPVAVAEHLHAGFDLDQTLFGRGQGNAPWQKKAGQGLNMSPTQSASGHKFPCYSLRSSHTLILNGYGSSKPFRSFSCRSSNMSARNAIINLK